MDNLYRPQSMFPIRMGPKCTHAPLWDTFQEPPMGVGQFSDGIPERAPTESDLRKLKHERKLVGSL